jgi:taurine dioxygenase/sulfonate dioxygenase
MAPSVQQLPEETPVVSTEKAVPIVVKDPEESPKVKRQIDLEGGKTDAKVRKIQGQLKKQH